MPWVGFRFVGSAADLQRENQAHAAAMAEAQRVAADLARQTLLVKGRC